MHFFQSATTKRIWAIYNQFQFRFSYLPVLLYISKYPASCFFILIKNQLILNKNKEIQSPLIWKVLIIISRAYTYSFVKLWYQFKLFYYCVIVWFLSSAIRHNFILIDYEKWYIKHNIRYRIIYFICAIYSILITHNTCFVKVLLLNNWWNLKRSSDWDFFTCIISIYKTLNGAPGKNVNNLNFTRKYVNIR